MDSTTMLEMLLATDEQVEDDFSFLCQLLEDSPSEAAEDSDTSMPNLEQLSTNSSTQPPDRQATKRKAPKQDALPAVGSRNRFQYRQREELKQLRGHVESLKAQLASERLKHQALSKPQDRNQVSQWELAARQQLLERNHALNENKQLEEALEEQATFLDQMQRFFMKKPRFAALSDGTSSDDWKALKLTAQQSLREAAIHAIADRQYRRMQHAFITAGLFGLAHDKYLSAMPRLQPDGSVLVEVKRQTLHPAPFRVVSKAFWDACSAHASNAEADINFIDSSTSPLQHCSKLLSRRHARHHFASLSAGGPLVPHMERGVWSWSQVEQTNDPKKCRQTTLTQVRVKVPPGVPEHLVMEIIQRGIERYGFDQLSNEENAHVQLDNEVTAAIMEYGKRMQRAVTASVAAAIEAYLSQKAQG
ncbi:hypothetical protein AeMF1_003994 [Aphanomyces euteiches]|nr:hypothetical protein AeMF1_003994 [Aphanomyces euteiches]KAH9187937.1 hypothetical protein AeNC1_010083 [Aphanomyces euteiches]